MHESGLGGFVKCTGIYRYYLRALLEAIFKPDR